MAGKCSTTELPRQPNCWAQSIYIIVTHIIIHRLYNYSDPINKYLTINYVNDMLPSPQGAVGLCIGWEVEPDNQCSVGEHYKW